MWEVSLRYQATVTLTESIPREVYLAARYTTLKGRQLGCRTAVHTLLLKCSGSVGLHLSNRWPPSQLPHICTAWYTTGTWQSGAKQQTHTGHPIHSATHSSQCSILSAVTESRFFSRLYNGLTGPVLYFCPPYKWQPQGHCLQWQHSVSAQLTLLQECWTSQLCSEVIQVNVRLWEKKHVHNGWSPLSSC